MLPHIFLIMHGYVFKRADAKEHKVLTGRFRDFRSVKCFCFKKKGRKHAKKSMDDLSEA